MQFQGGGRDRNAKPQGYGAAAFIFAVIWLFLAWPWLSGRVTIPWDAKAHFYPQFVFLARSLHAGESPFWTPNIFDGWPQVADPQSLIFAPFYLLAAAIAPNPGLQLADGVLFAMLGAGGLAIFLYARDSGWRAEGALVPACAFAFGGSAAWRIQHVGQVMSLAWFPVCFFLLARALDRGGAQAFRTAFGWGLLAGAASAFMVLGRDQIAWLQVLILAAYVVYRLCLRPGVAENIKNFIAPLSGGLLAGLAVALLPVLMTVSLSAQSNRPALILSEVVKGSLHPASFLTLFSANLFGIDGPLALFWGPPSPAWGETGLYLARNMGSLYFGVLPIVALFAAIAGARGHPSRGAGVADVGFIEHGALNRDRRFRDMPFFIVAAILLTLYALGRYTPAFAVLFHLPGADLWRRPADATFPLCAILAISAGYALDSLLRREKKWRPVVAIALCVAALGLCLSVAVWKDSLGAAVNPLIGSALFWCGAILLLAWLLKCPARKPGLNLFAIGLFMALDLSVGAGPNESTALPPSDFAMLTPDSQNATIAVLKARLAAKATPDRRDRIELAGLGFAWPNASLSHGLDHDLGYNPLRLALFEAFTAAGDHVGLPEQRVFSKAFPSYRSIAADLTGLRFIATGVPVEQIDPSLKPGDLDFVARTADAYIYENPRAMPRVFIAGQAIEVDFKTIIETGAWPDVDYYRTVLLQAPQRDIASSAPETRSNPAASAKIVAYHNTDILVDIVAPNGGWLVLTDAYHPGWTCEIDGQPQKIQQADVMFRAVKLPPGAKQARFQFKPLRDLWQK